MAWQRAGKADALPPGGVQVFKQGSLEVAICNVSGELHAVDNICPHRGGPLAMGALHGSQLVCPWHGWEFDCKTGVCDFNPMVTLRQFPVRVEEGEILVETGE